MAILKVHIYGLSAYNYPVVDSIKVCIEALVVPPTAVGDLSADVTTVRGAEALLVVVPAERVLHCPTEARHMETVLMLLIFHTANTHTHTQNRTIGNYVRENSWFCMCFTTVCTGAWQQPEALVHSMFVLVAPVLQVDAETVVSLGAQVMYVFVAQPEL